jgi:CRISPR-associated protein Csh1
MINTFKEIGYFILIKDGYFKTDKIAEKRKILLSHQSLVPYEKKDKNGNKLLDGRAICLNFDLEKKRIEFKQSETELIKENREYFFAFKLGSPNDKKKFLSTNNITTFYSSLLKESIEYINDIQNKGKSKKWFNENISEDYKEFLKSIRRYFYIKKDDNYFLNHNLLIDQQKEIFNNITNKFPKKKIDEIYNRFLNKLFFDSDSKDIINFPSIFIVLFNNKTILDFVNGKYRDDYINLCYYDLLKRFSLEKGIENKICHICKKENKIIQNLPLSMKFYGTTNSLNFERLSSTNAYKSFAVCENCLTQILTGMKYIQNTFTEYLFDLNAYLIPSNLKDKSFDAKLYKRIIKILRTNKSKYKNEIEQINDALKKANRHNLTFNLMFFYHPAGSQQFDILKLISNIELNKLIPKLEAFDKMTKNYSLDYIGNGTNTLTLNNLRYYLFPSYLSHKNPGFNIYGKDLLNFMESFLTDNKINYFTFIQKFISIYKKRLNRNKLDILSAFKMNLIISIFYKLKLIKEGGIVNNGQFVTSVLKNEYQEFFDVHFNVYGDNAFRQGLFLLGTVISKINYVQKEKSSNFLKKLNFEGIPIRRIPSLINQVKNYEGIYRKKIFQEKGIWGNIMDRLQDIESSGMKPDEVLFYILTGISFEDYLGMKKGIDKKLNENKNEGEIK